MILEILYPLLELAEEVDETCNDLLVNKVMPPASYTTRERYTHLIEYILNVGGTAG
jgi:hypothetical protein